MFHSHRCENIQKYFIPGTWPIVAALLPGQDQLSTAWKLLNQNNNNDINKVSRGMIINKTRAGRASDIDFRPHSLRLLRGKE